jgi:hypothetical protein
LRNIHASQLDVQCSSVSSRPCCRQWLLTTVSDEEAKVLLLVATTEHKSLAYGTELAPLTAIMLMTDFRVMPQEKEERDLLSPAVLGGSENEKCNVLLPLHGELLISAMHSNLTTNTWVGLRHFSFRESVISQCQCYAETAMPKPSQTTVERSRPAQHGNTVIIHLDSLLNIYQSLLLLRIFPDAHLSFRRVSKTTCALRKL